MLESLLHGILERQIRLGLLRVTYPSGRSESYGHPAPGAPEVSIHFTDRAALRAVVLDPGLGAPETYMDGRLLIDGDVYDLIAITKGNMQPEVSTPTAAISHRLRRLLSASAMKAIGVQRARANIAHHYDLDERLYRLFLDGDMQYSCAFFERPDMTLDQAQLAKKRLIAAKSLIRPGARVLDIGCGWGGMALYLARVCGADVTGITLSEEQLRVATERAEAAGLADRVRFRLQDYRELAETFDTIISVGMFEHVGQRQFPAFFDTLARCLAPDGVGLLHAMAQPYAARYNQPFIEKYIFPGGYVPALSEFMPAFEASGLLVRDIEILSLHYAETVRRWRERFRSRHDAVLELCDERFFRMWDFYLAGSEAAFRFDHLHVFHLQFAHDQARVPLTRDYIAPAMAALAEAERAVPEYAALHDTPRPRHGTGRRANG